MITLLHIIRVDISYKENISMLPKNYKTEKNDLLILVYKLSKVYFNSIVVYETFHV